MYGNLCPRDYMYGDLCLGAMYGDLCPRDYVWRPVSSGRCMETNVSELCMDPYVTELCMDTNVLETMYGSCVSELFVMTPSLCDAIT
ncbi:hypothetical protein DPMN_160716 [Dreissena polymorpha]|uniref:Uncharacterized protein n=1 Tax=Dreissena polymorpha TaxID=45954 RepID=A0A9D4IP08_DREPO|nr:hypothetical protein DPMN_160716 [Dreissena polymorpha]